MNIRIEAGAVMDQTTVRLVPGPAPRHADPLAVAVANASLLGIGYLLLGRRLLAVGTALVSIVLVVLLATVAPALWFEFVVLAWWVLQVALGALLAQRHRFRPLRPGRQRLAALAVGLPVLLAFGLLRFDAAGIEQGAVDARAEGDCAAALAALDGVWSGHRMADAPLTARTDRTELACTRLREAGKRLGTALSGDTGALADGYAELTGVHRDLPGHGRMIRATLDRFLAGLPTDDPCATAAITDRLRDRRTGEKSLDPSAAVARTAPAAIVDCGDELMDTDDWPAATQRYQQLLEQYPDNALADRARRGVREATLAIELADVRRLLVGPRETQPAYCSSPARYSAAPPYRKGVNRALVYGNPKYAGKLPGSWRAPSAPETTLVVCLGDPKHGAAVQSCPYEGGPESGYAPISVTFHKIAIPVQGYELRTGKLVIDRTVQISGSSCPEVVSYTSYGPTDPGPPPNMYVTASLGEVRAGFRPVFVR